MTETAPSKSMPASPLMTLQELRDYLKVHEMTIYRWAKKHKVPGLKIGGRWRFKRSDIDAMFEPGFQGFAR